MDDKNQSIEGRLKQLASWFVYLKYIMAILVACICILVGIYGPQWFSIDSIRRCLSSALCVSAVLSICVVFLSIGIYGQRAGWRHYYAALFPLLIVFSIALSLDFRWEILKNPAIILGTTMLIFSPLLLKRKKARTAKKRDLLGRRLLYCHMGRTLREYIGDSPKHGVTLLVSGPWGSGKTHFIDYVVSDLQDPIEKKGNEDIYQKAFGVARVDVWKSRDIQEMWKDVACAVTSVVFGYNFQINNEWRSNVIDFLKMLHFPISSFADDVLRLVMSGVGGDKKEEELIEHLKKRKQAYVLVLDNIDRCKSDKQRALFPLIEGLKIIPGLITICGVATDGQLKPKKEKRYISTLQKLFDLTVNLSEPDKAYMRPYLEREVEKLKDPGKALVEWVADLNFCFDTPRQVEVIVRQLNYIEKCYLSRLPEDEEHTDAEKISLGVTKKQAVLYWIVLEMLYPSLVFRLKNMKNFTETLRLLSKYLDENPEKDEKSQREIIEKELLLNFTGCELALFAKKHPLKNIVDRLLRAKNTDIQYAIKKDYMHLSALENDSCNKIILEFNKNTKITPRMALKTVLAEEVSDIEEPPVYDSVLRYAIKHANEENSNHYIDACLLSDILTVEGGSRPIYQSMYLESDGLILSLIDKSVELELKNQEMFENCRNMAEKMCFAVKLSVLRNILNIITEYLEDKYETSYDTVAPSLCTLLEKFRENWEINVGPMRDVLTEFERAVCLDRLRLLIRGYAYAFCRELFKKNIQPKDGIVKIWRLDRECPDWPTYMSEGVEAFAKSKGGRTVKAETVKIILLSILHSSGKILNEDNVMELGKFDNVLVFQSHVTLWKSLYELYLQGRLHILNRADYDHLKIIKQQLMKFVRKRTEDENAGSRDTENDKHGKIEGANQLLKFVNEMIGAYENNQS